MALNNMGITYNLVHFLKAPNHGRFWPILALFKIVPYSRMTRPEAAWKATTRRRMTVLLWSYKYHSARVWGWHNIGGWYDRMTSASGHLDLQIPLLCNSRLRARIGFSISMFVFLTWIMLLFQFQVCQKFGSIDLLTVSRVDLTKSSKFEFSDAPNWHWLHSSGKKHGNNGNCMTHMMRDMSIFWRQDTEQICQTNW